MGNIEARFQVSHAIRRAFFAAAASPTDSCPERMHCSQPATLWQALPSACRYACSSCRHTSTIPVKGSTRP